MDYRVVRSNRKSLSLEIRPDGSVLVRAPYAATNAQVARFVASHEDWITAHQEKVRARAQAAKESGEHLSYEDIQKLANRALEVIPQRVRYYAPRMGVTYGRITIRNQKTRWGSCSAKGNLNFNCLLVLMPEEILDYVVVHELAHRKEMNHSAAFWQLVENELPDYRERRKWLKDNGDRYMRMMLPDPD